MDQGHHASLDLPLIPLDSSSPIEAAELAAILDCMRRGRDGSLVLDRPTAMRLVGLISGEMSAASGGGGLALWQKRRIDLYIDQNLHRSIMVETLAGQVSLSISHFTRAFKTSYGITPHAHIVALRIDRASRLLATTSDSLSDVALRCGMADQSHLSRLFKRWRGATPTAWRRQHVALRKHPYPIGLRPGILFSRL